MNKHALQHIIDSSYCFPISPNEIVLRLRTARGDLVSAQVIYESKYVIGMRQKTADMRKAYETELYDFYEVKLVLKDTRIGYVFYLNDGEKYYYFSEDGATLTYNFELGFYNFFQYPYINEADIMDFVPWMEKACFYQIFVERFNMGDKTKNMDYINCKWGDVPTPKTFAGGDIKGITKKLSHINKIGCNAIYLTPVFESISNHKYDIADYYQVDRQFGTNDDLKELIKKAHQKGMKVVLDAVFNHCSERLEQFQDVVRNGRNSKYFDWFVIKGDKINASRSNYETFASCKYMPKFNTSNPEVQKYLIDIATHYIKEYDIDGWRLDVSDEISHYFWRMFRTEVKATKKDAVIIGENWHDASNYLRGDQYDSIMNYAFTKACLDYFSTGTKNAKEFAWQLNSILMRNTGIVNNMMLNLLDSHDTHRFFKEVDSNRFKMKAALCILYLFPGAPCIFYGTEILVWGGYDPDCRRCMDWTKAKSDGEYSDIYNLIMTLANIRNKEKLISGTIKIYSENDEFIYENVTTKRTIRLTIDIVNRKLELSKNGGILINE